MKAFKLLLSIALALAWICPAHGAILSVTDDVDLFVDKTLPSSPGFVCDSFFPQPCHVSRSLTLHGQGKVERVQLIFEGHLLWSESDVAINDVPDPLLHSTYRFADHPFGDVTLTFDSASSNILPTFPTFCCMLDQPLLQSGTYRLNDFSFGGLDPTGWDLTYTVTLRDWGTGDQTRMSSFSIVAYTVPEPGTLALLLALALGGLALTRRRWPA